jgi:NADH-quinone oxidoreductase subunit A
MEQYGSLALMMLVAFAFGVGLLVAGAIFGPRRPNDAKESPYECGVVPVGDARTRFPVRYYLVALVFVLFDLEAVFIYPWAVTFRQQVSAGNGAVAFGEMVLFMAILVVGLLYLWRRGALDWE